MAQDETRLVAVFASEQKAKARLATLRGRAS